VEKRRAYSPQRAAGVPEGSLPTASSQHLVGDPDYGDYEAALR
jgi:hypothetical protein